MSNKTNIEEDIKILKTFKTRYKTINYNRISLEDVQAIENILADRETTKEDYKILENNYQMLSEDVSNIAKELDLEEDATIDEIITKIRILKSKRINMFEQLDYIAKANKYDSLVEKIKEEKERTINEGKADREKHTEDVMFRQGYYMALEELLDTEL